MPLVHALTRQKFSDAGPVPQVLNMGKRQAVMLLCLQKEQELRAPESDTAETLFYVLAGSGRILEGEVEHQVEHGDVVHIPLGTSKALIAGSGTFSVLGVRAMKERAG